MAILTYLLWPYLLYAYQVRKRFLVATLNTARWRDPSLPAVEPEVSSGLLEPYPYPYPYLYPYPYPYPYPPH